MVIPQTGSRTSVAVWSGCSMGVPVRLQAHPLRQMRLPVLSLHVLLRSFIEFAFAGDIAEVKGLALILALAGRFVWIYLHSANWILLHIHHLLLQDVPSWESLARL